MNKLSAEDEFLMVKGLGKRFGGVQAVHDYHLRLGARELVGLIGPNGAGKTTVFNLLSGVLAPDAGQIILAGRTITGQAPHRQSAAGIARTFQNIRLFGNLSVKDNILVAFHRRWGRGFWSTLMHTPAFRKSEKDMAHRAEEILSILHLDEARDQPVRDLPYGLQRRVELGRALAAQPRLLLLDEPAAGLNPHESEELAATIRYIHQEFPLAILLVEHDMKLVMNICPRLQVLDRGSVLAEGRPAEIQQDPRVITAYLGAPKERKCA